MNNPLKTLIPVKVRLWAYAVGFIGMACWSVYEASGGDWKKAVPLGLTSLMALMAGSNVDTAGEEG